MLLITNNFMSFEKMSFDDLSFDVLGEYFKMDEGSFKKLLEGRSFIELDRLLDCADGCLYEGGSKDFDIDAIRGKMVIIESRLKAVAPCVCDAVYHGPYRGERLPGCGEIDGFDDCCGDCECERGGCARGIKVCRAALKYGRMWECDDCEGSGGCRQYG